MAEFPDQRVEIQMSSMEIDLQFKEKVTVKFMTGDPLQVFTHSFNIRDTVEMVKRSLQPVFNIPYKNIAIYKDDEELRDKDVLGNFEINEFGILQLKLLSKDEKQPLKLASAYQQFVIPDIITVKIEDGDEDKEIVVEIENRAIPQPRLGGYKNTKTSKGYVYVLN